jgi:TolB protein
MKACRPECGLWTVDLQGGGPVQVTFRGTDSFPYWRAGQVIFSSEQAGNWDIYRIRIDEIGRPLGEPEALTTDPAQDITPVFGPDGQQIYFRSSREGQWAIWVMNADGSEPRRLIVTGGSDDWKAERIAVIAAQ